MADVEMPKYEVLSADDNIEVRQYEAMIMADVHMNGARKEAISHGFRLLANYIFGDNIAQRGTDMIPSVQQQERVKISMTAPVQQQFIGNNWQISFIMPSEYTMDTLPKPVNNLVTLTKVPSKKFVVITFSGINSDTNVMEHEEKLIEYIKSQNLSITGSPKYAFYNPPWTLPPVRRNEVMIEIQV